MKVDKQLLTTVFSTDLQWVGLQWIHTKLVGVTFGHTIPLRALGGLPMPEATVTDLPVFQQNLVTRVTRYASGQPQDLLDVEVDYGDRTPFQIAILEACRDVAWGETATYGELAARAGYPGAARAVGNVMAHNPLPLIVPCHRIVASGNGKGGFSAPGGVSMKRRLLTMEQRSAALT